MEGLRPVDPIAMKIFHQLVKRAYDEVPKQMVEFVKRVTAGEQDCPSPWRLAMIDAAIVSGGICPRCGYVSVSHPFCPKDGARLVEGK